MAPAVVARPRSSSSGSPLTQGRPGNDTLTSRARSRWTESSSRVVSTVIASILDRRERGNQGKRDSCSRNAERSANRIMTSREFIVLSAFLAVSFAPSVAMAGDAEPLKGAVIVVDPGHGGQRYSKSYTGGTRGVVSKVTESELNLRVAVELRKLLAD